MVGRVVLALVLLEASAFAEPGEDSGERGQQVTLGLGGWEDVGDSEHGGTASTLQFAIEGWPHIYLGGRILILRHFEFNILGGRSESQGGVIDFGPVAGVGGRLRWLSTRLTVGPVLSLVEKRRDGELESEARPGLAVDVSGAAILTDTFGFGMHYAVNLNRSRSVYAVLLALAWSL